MLNFANCETRGTDIQRGILLHVQLNILSISLLSRVNNTFGYFVMQKGRHVILGFEEN